LRVLTGAVCGLLAGLFGVVIGGFHIYDLLTALMLLLLTPAATLLLVSCFGEAGMTLLFSTNPLGQARNTCARNTCARETGIRRRLRGVQETAQTDGEAVTRKFHALPICSVCFLLTCVVFAARGFSPALGSPYLTISLATLLGLVLTLTAATRLGVIPGLAVGVLCGLAASPALSPIFILCAGVYGLLSPVSPRVAATAGCLAGAMWCWGVEGMGTLLPLLPAILLSPPFSW
jgi:hypothetical protein